MVQEDPQTDEKSNLRFFLHRISNLIFECAGVFKQARDYLIL